MTPAEAIAKALHDLDYPDSGLRPGLVYRLAGERLAAVWVDDPGRVSEWLTDRAREAELKIN